MSVSIRPPLLTSTSDLDEPEPWVMTAVPGAVLVAPIRLLTARQRLATSPEDLVLGLTDLGYLGSPRAPAAAAGIQVVPAPSELVLVLPAELLDHVARVRLRALRFGVQVATSAQSFDPDAWLTTWHHFVDSTQGLAMTLLDQSREANGDLRFCRRMRAGGTCSRRRTTPSPRCCSTGSAACGRSPTPNNWITGTRASRQIPSCPG